MIYKMWPCRLLGFLKALIFRFPTVISVKRPLLDSKEKITKEGANIATNEECVLIFECIAKRDWSL